MDVLSIFRESLHKNKPLLYISQPRTITCPQKKSQKQHRHFVSVLYMIINKKIGTAWKKSKQIPGIRSSYMRKPKQQTYSYTSALIMFSLHNLAKNMKKRKYVRISSIPIHTLYFRNNRSKYHTWFSKETNIQVIPAPRYPSTLSKPLFVTKWNNTQVRARIDRWLVNTDYYSGPRKSQAQKHMLPDLLQPNGTFIQPRNPTRNHSTTTAFCSCSSKRSLHCWHNFETQNLHMKRVCQWCATEL